MHNPVTFFLCVHTPGKQRWCFWFCLVWLCCFNLHLILLLLKGVSTRTAEPRNCLHHLLKTMKRKVRLLDFHSNSWWSRGLDAPPSLFVNTTSQWQKTKDRKRFSVKESKSTNSLFTLAAVGKVKLLSCQSISVILPQHTDVYKLVNRVLAKRHRTATIPDISNGSFRDDTFLISKCCVWRSHCTGYFITWCCLLWLSPRLRD